MWEGTEEGWMEDIDKMKDGRLRDEEGEECRMDGRWKM
jgi:hypothetical protein